MGERSAIGRGRGDRRKLLRRIALGALLAALAAGCGSATPSTTPAPSGSAGTGTGTASPASGARVQLISPVPQVDVPAPSLTDPAAIGAALRDPATAADGVVSMLAAAGIGIYRQDGAPLRPGLEKSEHDPWVYDAEALGLIDMAQADGAAIAGGGVPFTLEDLRAALVPLLPDLTTDQLLAAYRSSFLADPGGLVAAVVGPDLTAATPLTRTELWLLFVHGFIGIPAATAMRSQVASVDEWGAPAAAPGSSLAGLPFIPSPEPGIDARDYALLLAHVPLAAYLIPFQEDPPTASVHEGHGGPGAPASFAAFHTSWYQSPAAPFSGRPLLLPASGGLDGLNVTWSSPDAGVLDEHGTLSGALDVPMPTDASGRVTLTYTPKPEKVRPPIGPTKSVSAQLFASVPIGELFAAHFQVPVGAQGLLMGDRRVPVALAIEWHWVAGWSVDGASGGGRVTGQHCGDPAGDWIVKGTYDVMGMRGVQKWDITVDPGGSGGNVGTYTYEQTSKGRPGGSPIEVTVKGEAAGSVTLTIDQDSAIAHMHFKEQVHTYTAKAGPGRGTSMPLPLEESDLDWAPDPSC